MASNLVLLGHFVLPSHKSGGIGGEMRGMNVSKSKRPDLDCA